MSDAAPAMRRRRGREREEGNNASETSASEALSDVGEEEGEEEEEEEDEFEEEGRTRGLEADEFEDPMEATLDQLVQEVATTEWADEELTTRLNMIAEALEEAETAFRKDRTPPYRREGHLVGTLLQVLEHHDEFYPMLESKLSELTDSRVKAAVCRVLLATVPVNSRFIVRLLYDEDTLDRMCDYAADDIVVNKEVSIKFLKRVRLYASKLERERNLATKYMQERLRAASAGARVRRSAPSTAATTGGSRPTAPGSASAQQRTSLKRKHSEINGRSTTDRGLVDTEGESTQHSTQDESEDLSTTVVDVPAQSTSLSSMEDEQLASSAGRDIIGFQPDPERHEEDIKRLVMLELLYTLDCIGLMGEYLELFAPALKEDIIGTVITFLHSKNPTVLSHTMKLTSHFLVHKKFCFSLIDVGGVDLIFGTAKMQQGMGQIGLLDRSLSMCLHGLASSNAVMEKVLALDSETLLSVSFGLLSSPNDRARQNAVVFFGLTLTFKTVLEHFEKESGLYTLLNIIRAGNNPKSAVQRQLSHDACLCLRQYLRVHMALVTHRLRRRLSQLNHPSNRSNSATPLLTAAPALARLPVRVPKLQSFKPIDIDDKTHEQNLVFYEKYQFSVPGGPGGSGTPWSAANGPGGTMWPPAAKLSHLRGPLVMLEVVAMMASLIQSTDSEENSNTIRMWIVERAQFCLECLRVLTLVVPSLSNEVCSTDVVVDESGSMKRSGMTILLEIATSTNSRDSDLVRDALHVFCNCVSPPHTEECWQHPHKDIRQFTLTARNMRKQQPQHFFSLDQSAAEDESVLACCARVKDDKALRPVRKLARDKNAIKVCIQLLRYKRSVQNADAIRLLATRALLGLSRDRHIAQVLEKMQLGQLLSDLIRQDPVLEENADLHVRFRETALDLISLVTHRAPNAVINEATDPTVRKIEKASIVAQTPITYDQNELLRLIHDHLMFKGLTESAAALAREVSLSEGEVVSLRTLEKLRSRSFGSAPSSNDVAHSIRSAYHGQQPTAERPSKIPRVEAQPFSLDTKSTEPDQYIGQSRKPSSTGTLTLSFKLPHGERRKRIRQAFSTAHLFEPKAPTLKKSLSDPTTTPKLSGHRVKPVFGTIDSSRKTHLSRLDDIITHYLREQHRQCANPVTTVPPFKLLGGDVHRCPDHSGIAKTPVNICSRIAERCRSTFRHGIRSFASPYADTGINRYVYSRYRPYRIVDNHGSSHWGASVARFYGDDQTELVMGNHDGQVRLIQIDTDHIVEEWSCHATSSAILDLEMNEATRMGTMNRLIMTGAVSLTEFGESEVAIWDVKTMEDARWRFPGGLSPRFNHYGDRVVALDARTNSEEHDMENGRGISGAVMIDISTGSVLCKLQDSVQSNDYKRDTNCCFAPDDSTILTGGMLWDARIPTRALYKFDKLSNVGHGFFHPNGNEVIINSAVWDLRTYQLLRMVPALDKCTVRFNSTASVMFAYSPHSVIDDLERRRPKAKTWFRVLDARDYKDISTIELQRPIYDLAVDRKSTLLSTVEGRYLDADRSTEDDPTCRLYEIGRKRPSEDDSDVEDGLDGSDTMDDDEFDDESNSEEEEEEDEDLEDEDDEMDDDEDDYDSYAEDEEDGVEYLGEDEDDMDEDEESDENERDDSNTSRRRSRGPSSLARDIQLLFELPDDAYYEVHDDYSSEDEEDVDEEE